MSTMSEAKLKKMQAKVAEASHEKTDLTPVKTLKKETAQEKRSVKILSNVKPSEKKAFIDLIGRKTESDAVRELVLAFIEANK